MATKKNHSTPGLTLIVTAVIVALTYVLMWVANVWTPRLGLDLRGGTTITLTARTTDGSAVTSENLEEARRIIQQRVDSLGVGEAIVTTQGDQHIDIAVPNVQKDELIKLVGTTAQLAFRAVNKVAPVATSPEPSADPSPGESPDVNPDPSASAQINPQPSASAAPTSQPSASVQPTPSIPPSVPGLPRRPATPRPTAPSGTQPDTQTLLQWKPTERDLDDFDEYKCSDKFPDVPDQPLITCDDKGQAKYLLGPVLLPGTQVTNAAVGRPQNAINYVVNLEFSAEGSAAFRAATSALYTKNPPENQFAIVLDSKVVVAPAPNGPISGGAEISGNYNLQNATQLANILKYGALPLAFDVSQVETVSATLGGEQLSGGIIAGIIGLVLVISYSIIYYRALGIVVIGSLVAAAAITYSSMVLLGEAVGFALNLPGIAGAIVAIGLTADSFIIYFERIRDEIREGRSLRTAIETGWQRARSTIVIADMVSVLSAVVLFFLAVGGVKGFAFTLGLTTIIDLAVVFWFTKPLMSLLGRTKFFGQGHKLSGLDPEHMGVSRESLLGRRSRRTAKVKEA